MPLFEVNAYISQHSQTTSMQSSLLEYYYTLLYNSCIILQVVYTTELAAL